MREICRILFRAASETLLTIAADPKRLGAHVGFLAVLHTWGQNLHLHPHLHCVVPSGGISPDGLRWIGCKKNTFFLPVKVLSSRFRRLFLTYMEEAFRKGRLKFYGDMAGLAQPSAFEALYQQTRRIQWVVFVKPPFGGPEQVLKYLARYTHRVAISNRRLLSMEDGRVSFEYKDYADSNPDEGDDAGCGGVHPALSPPHPAQRLCAHLAVRLSGQSNARKETRALPHIVKRRRTGESQQQGRRTAWQTLPCVRNRPSLRWFLLNVCPRRCYGRIPHEHSMA